jgi:AraC-like DNA-binding protein
VETADVAKGLPHPGLRPIVRQYVGYRMEGFSPGVHRGLPSRYLTFLISIGRPIETLSVPAGSHLPPSLQALVGGLQTGPTMVCSGGDEEGIAVELTPVGARSLFGLPAVELTSHVVDLADLLGAAGRTLPERLAATCDWPSRFRLLDEVLCRAARPKPAPGTPAEIAHAWHQLMTGKRPAVLALATDVGWSRRHFTEVFHREVGLPPRQFVRVLRFERSAIALARHPGTPLGELAQRCGYYDQAHLYRDWRDLAGCSPTAWAQHEELPSVHDAALNSAPR